MAFGAVSQIFSAYIINILRSPVVLLFTLVLICTAYTLFYFFARHIDMDFSKSIFALLIGSLASAATVPKNSSVDLGWYAPKKSWINDLGQVLNGTGTHGFVFSGSQLPAGVKYGTYNWCNMPHVRKEEYPKASEEYELVYVEV